MISLRPLAMLTTVSLFGLLATLAGCSGESATTNGADTTAVASKDTTAADPSTAAGTVAAPGAMHGHGPDSLLVAALREPSMNLTDAQKATIQSALDASRPAAPPIDHTRISALAAGIRAGNVDPTTITVPVPDHAAHQAAEAKALTTLHATLTPAQRATLVAVVTQRMANGPKDHLDRGGPKAGMGPMGHLLEGLDLTQAQQDTIQAKLAAQRPAPPSDADRAAMKAQHEAFRAQMQTKLQTFATESFDATAFTTPPSGAAKPPQGRADRFASELAVITSVLEPAQREKLATKIEAGPPLRPVPQAPATVQAPVQQP